MNYSKSTSTYKCDWVDRSYNLDLSDYEFFITLVTFYEFFKGSLHSDEVACLQKLQSARDFNSDTYLDLSSGDLSNDSINHGISYLLKPVIEAIRNYRKVQFLYESSGLQSEIRTVHPYKIVHSQHSFYLWAWCEDRYDFRMFKLNRLSKLKVSQDTFQAKKDGIAEQIKDAWYLRVQPNKKIQIKVKFYGEAASSIKEYKLHHSQETLFESEKETIVSWTLSVLSEFASWLCQWLGNFIVLEPLELRLMIDKKVKKYGELNK
ncbi:MAG: WYL domain-containing protein [Lentisphaeraceae bacterium]|nr:WYL domain-containing protein [Lentisphaeraceae bacterium]